MSFKYHNLFMNSYLKISRPLNSAITFFVIIIGAIISIEGEYSILKIILAGIAGCITTAAGNVINDVFDIEVDKINRPNRPLPLNKITTKSALNYYYVLLIFSSVIAFQINLTAFLIVIMTHSILFLYSFKLKKIFLIGNISIALLTGLAFIFGGVSVNNYKAAIIPALFAMLINFIRELIKDIQDLTGDSFYNIKTVPQKIGVIQTKHFMLVVTCVLILFTFYPFITAEYKIEYFIIVMIFVNPILVFVIKSLYADHKLKNLNKLSFILKLNMIFGLTAIYFGK